MLCSVSLPSVLILMSAPDAERTNQLWLRARLSEKRISGLPVRYNLTGSFRYYARPAKQHADTEAYHDNACESFLPFDNTWVFT